MQVDTPRACLPFPSGPGPRPVSFRHHYHHPPARAHAVEEGDGRHTHGCGWARAFGVVGGGVTGAWGRWAYGPDPRLPPLGTTPPDDTTGGGKRGWVEGKRKEKGGVDPNTPDPRK
uniref:Uncharacterized protein n=1 Tax=Human herpesvirus 2 TaxID=10310 RepID=A0A481TLU2_HHV2|nr:hypothetical protein [Human alphaherpesvirus 2]QBH83374.1 hypothetical protein [Human alphaherpesvirus 2]